MCQLLFVGSFWPFTDIFCTSTSGPKRTAGFGQQQKDARSARIDAALKEVLKTAVTAEPPQIDEPVQSAGHDIKGMYWLATLVIAAGVGNSGRRKFNFSTGASNNVWTYDVPAHPAGVPVNTDYLGIWADTSGTGSCVQINDLTIRLVDDQVSGQ